MKFILKFAAKILVKYLQRKYKKLTIDNKYNQTTQIIHKLEVIQAILYYFKKQFYPWGYFHPDCIWSEKDKKKFKKLFPLRDFEEIAIVVWHNPEAVTYYHNKIWELTKEQPPHYATEIKKQLIKWDKEY